MRLYQAGALRTGARSELVPYAGMLVDGTRTVAAGLPHGGAGNARARR